MDTQLTVRVPESLKTALTERADREQRTVANLIRVILTAAVAPPRRPRGGRVSYPPMDFDQRPPWTTRDEAL